MWLEKHISFKYSNIQRTLKECGKFRRCDISRLDCLLYFIIVVSYFIFVLPFLVRQYLAASREMSTVSHGSKVGCFLLVSRATSLNMIWLNCHPRWVLNCLSKCNFIWWNSKGHFTYFRILSGTFVALFENLINFHITYCIVMRVCPHNSLTINKHCFLL